MSIIDIEKLISPISDEAPCGEDLEYDPQFGEMERASKGKASQVMGDQEIEAEPPDWSRVYELALTLFERTLDLRSAVLLTRAALVKHGPEGMADGLEVIARLIEQYWDGVYPQLDAEDNLDPTLRLNTLLPLTDPEEMIADILQMPLVASRAVGKFSVRDWQVANGELSPLADQQNVPDTALLNAAFMDVSVEEIEANANNISRALTLVKTFGDAILNHVGGAVAPDFSVLINALRKIQAILNEQLVARGVGVEAAEEGSGTGGAPAAGIAGEVQSRDDVVRMIDKICQFYDRAEPSSPVPLVLKRARRLVHMSFMEILQDMTPDGVDQARRISGVYED